VLEKVVQIGKFDQLVSRLRDLGYHICTQVLDAADFGVPQTQRRLFVLADRDREPPQVVSRSQRALAAADILDVEGSWTSRPLRLRGDNQDEKAASIWMRMGRG